MERHDHEPPPSLQVLYDEGYVTDLAVFCCPNTSHRPGPADQIDRWSDYRYAPSDNMWKDAEAGGFGLPMLMDKALANHGSSVYACWPDGHARWLPELDLHLVYNEHPEVVPDEIRAYYTKHAPEIEKLRSFMDFGISVDSPSYGVFHFGSSISNSSSDPIYCEVIASELVDCSGGGGLLGGITAQPPGRVIELRPGQTKEIGGMQLTIVDVVKNGVLVNRTVTGNGRSSSGSEQPPDIDKFNSRYRVKASLVVKVNSAEFKDLLVAFTPPRVRYLGSQDVFPPASQTAE